MATMAKANIENSQNVRECLRAHWRCGSASSGSVQTSCGRAEIWLLILNHHHGGGMGQKKPAEDHKQDHRVLSEDLLKCESREMMLKSHSPVPHPNAPFIRKGGQRKREIKGAISIFGE